MEMDGMRKILNEFGKVPINEIIGKSQEGKFR
jgi:hypothetical protein